MTYPNPPTAYAVTHHKDGTPQTWRVTLDDVPSYPFGRAALPEPYIVRSTIERIATLDWHNLRATSLCVPAEDDDHSRRSHTGYEDNFTPWTINGVRYTEIEAGSNGWVLATHYGEFLTESARHKIAEQHGAELKEQLTAELAARLAREAVAYYVSTLNGALDNLVAEITTLREVAHKAALASVGPDPGHAL